VSHDPSNACPETQKIKSDKKYRRHSKAIQFHSPRQSCRSLGEVFATTHRRDTFRHQTANAAIATAMGLQVITATLIGALLPLTAAKLKLDPAVVASPTLTTIVDITGLLIFFVTIKMFLGI
jgi:hypothetical protein